MLCWIGPAAGQFQIRARFTAADVAATTDVHVMHASRSLFDGWVRLHGSGSSLSVAKTIAVQRGEAIEFVVGFGNGNYAGNTTGISVSIRSEKGRVYDAARDFSPEHNPDGAWSCGYLAPRQKPDPSTFRRYMVHEVLGEDAVGSLSNPGSTAWQDVLSDQHYYPRVPHSPRVIARLRGSSGGLNPVFLSEYGVGSAVDLAHLTRHYEQPGKTASLDARAYRARLERFLAAWKRFRMAERFASPESYFKACLVKMAGQRLLGLNAVRANPNIVGYSMSSTVDQGLTGEGLFTTFRELKPGTVDGVFDGLAPLRWCLFVEPVHVYRGSRVRLGGRAG